MKLYSYYCLSLQKWCSHDYKIHGLWPDYDANSYPSYCTNTPFNLEELKLSWNIGTIALTTILLLCISTNGPNTALV